MTNISTMGQALEQVERIKDQQRLFSLLTTQFTTGKKTQSFSGLGTDILTSQRARADFSSLDVYVTNIKNADRRTKLMLTAIEEFQKQAKIISDAMTTFSQESVHQEGDVIYYDDPLTTEIENIPVGMTSSEIDGDLKTLQQSAANVFGIISDLLNAQDNDRYILNGASSLTKPLPSTGTLSTALSTLVSKWKAGTITTDQFIADLQDTSATAGNPDAISDSIVGYNAGLSAGNVGNVYARVDANSEVDYTALANEKPFRDILVTVAYIMNGDLGPMADAYIPPNTYPGVPDVEGAPGATLDEMKENFFAVFNTLTTMVNNALDGVDQIRFRLENSRVRLDEFQQSHRETSNFLSNTIADVEDIAPEEVALKLNTLQITLDASYRIAARLQELSLVNFL